MTRDNVEHVEVYSPREIDNAGGIGLATAVSLILIGWVLGAVAVGMVWWLASLYR